MADAMLSAVAALVTGLDVAEVVDGERGAHALHLAAHGWGVFPLRDKVPAIAGGHGVLDATTDVGQIVDWWSAMPTANIGARVPRALVVIDVDPRHGGD